MLFCSNRKRRVCLFEGKWTNCGLPVNILFVVCFRETTQSNDANTELSIFSFLFSMVILSTSLLFSDQ